MKKPCFYCKKLHETDSTGMSICEECKGEIKTCIAEREKIKNDLLDIADKGEYENMRREVERYFNLPSERS